MSSFFNSIRRFFDGGYDGRYFAILLHELACHEPRSFEKILGLIPNVSTQRPQLARDFRAGILVPKVDSFTFRGKSKSRRADFALVQGEKPALLMEIKEFDHRSFGNPEQARDYVREAKRTGAAFIYVSRFLPDEKVREQIEIAAHRHPVVMINYDEIYKALLSEDSDRPISRLICSYLEDIGVGVYRALSLKGDPSKSTSFMLVQMLGLPHQTGMGRMQSAESAAGAPDVLKAMLSNIEALAEWFRVPNIGCMPVRPMKRFWISPQFNIPTLRKDLNAKNAKNLKLAKLPRDIWGYAKGGSVWFEASSTIKVPHNSIRDRRLYLFFGFELRLLKADAPVRVSVYAQFGSSGFGKEFDLPSGNTFASSPYRRTFPTEATARSLLASVLQEAHQNAISEAKNPQIREALKRLKLPAL